MVLKAVAIPEWEQILRLCYLLTLPWGVQSIRPTNLNEERELGANKLNIGQATTSLQSRYISQTPKLTNSLPYSTGDLDIWKYVRRSVGMNSAFLNYVGGNTMEIKNKGVVTGSTTSSSQHVQKS